MSIRDSATRTVSQIRDQLETQAEALLAQIGEARGQVETSISDLDSRWEGLNARAEEILNRAQEVEDRLQQMGEQLATRAGTLREGVDGAMDQGRSVADATRNVIETLDQGVAALIPDIDEVAAAVESTFSAFGDQARSLDQALEETRAVTDRHIHDPFAALVTDLQNQLWDRGSQLGTYVDTDFTSTLDTAVRDFHSHVDTVVESAREKMEEARATAETEGSNALGQLNSMFGDQFGSLINTVETVSNTLRQVGDVISGTADAVGTTTQVMTSGTSMTAIGAKSVIGIVEDLIDIFNSVT